MATVIILSQKFFADLRKMENFNIEGDFEILSDSQLKLVERVLLKQGFKSGKVTVEPVGQKGDNYVANVKRFIYERNDGSFFKMIGKLAPSMENVRQMMNLDMMFTNEITMYEEVLPKFNELQNNAGVPDNERVKFPVCYGVAKEAPYELILLEDLAESGFEMLDRFQSLNDDAVRVTLKDLAIFHSLSFALKHFELETYRDFATKLKSMWNLMGADPKRKLYFENFEKDMKAIMGTEKQKHTITGTLSQVATLAKKLQGYEKSSKYCVIQQGDCWSNNILFRLENGQAVQNVMIDYQLSKESNPAADLLYFLFNCTNQGTRSKHFYEWIDYYHEILDKSLANYGLSSKQVFSRDQLDTELRRYAKMLIAVCMMVAQMLVRESKDAVDFKEVELEGTDGRLETVMAQMRAGNLVNPRLKERIEGIVNSALEFGLVN